MKRLNWWKHLAQQIRHLRRPRGAAVSLLLDTAFLLAGVWLVLAWGQPRLARLSLSSLETPIPRLLPTPALSPLAAIASPTPRPTLPPPPTPTSTPTPTATPTPPPTTLHIVQQGETLGAIARQYATTVDAIKQANALETDFLQIGQELIIPLDPNAVPNPPTATPSPTPTPTLAPGETRYTVQAGDTLFAIAQRFGVSADAIQKRNQLENAATLRVGQSLVIPAWPGTAPATPTAPTTPPPTASPSAALPLLPAPRLLAPHNGAILSDETPPRLTWQATTLPPDAWFEVMLWRDGEPPAVRDWTRATEWVLPSEYRGAIWNWRVNIVQGTWGVERYLLSEPGDIWRFTWR